MSTYLVTGGAGFIGSHLIEALVNQGHAVTVLDDLSTGVREQVPSAARFVQGDVANAELVASLMHGVEGCFHLAAVASVARGNADWIGTHRSNQTGTVCVLDAARAHGRVPVVYASSASVYGLQDAPSLHEGLPPAPICAYGADKLGSELHARVGFWVHGLPSVGLRFFNVYGPRQDPKSPYTGVISIFADRIAAGKPIVIHGDGKQTRDFVYVGDVVEHLLAGMKLLDANPGAYVLNVCTGSETSINDLAASVGSVVSKKPKVSRGVSRPGDMTRAIGCSNLSNRKLGVVAKVSVVDGLQQLISYNRQ